MHISVEKLIKRKILEQGRGWCFTPVHFWGLGSDLSIRKALSSLQKKQVIRRLAQGLYDFPETHNTLGEIPPNLNKVALAIAEKNGVKIQPSGAHAANLLGLSNQVPGKTFFLTEGPSKKVKIGNQEIIFKKASQKTMSSAGTKEGFLIQALKYFGKDKIDKTILNKVAKLLENSNQKALIENIKYAPAWIKSLIFKLTEPNNLSLEVNIKQQEKVNSIFANLTHQTSCSSDRFFRKKGSPVQEPSTV